MDPRDPSARAAQFEAAFSHIAATRMAGVPICHPGLRVQAIDFQASDGGVVGILVTPWFMNLLWLPLDPEDGALPVGASQVRSIGAARFPFIGAHEESCGRYEACSLFSPMADFEDHAAAEATARSVLEILRREPALPVASTDPPKDASKDTVKDTVKDAPPSAPLEAPARRGFLFGRGSELRESQS